MLLLMLMFRHDYAAHATTMRALCLRHAAVQDYMPYAQHAFMSAVFLIFCHAFMLYDIARAFFFHATT